MTTPRDTTLALIRALHRGATMPELEEATGLQTRTVLVHLRRLEEEGVRIIRPGPRGRWRGPGVYRLEACPVCE